MDRYHEVQLEKLQEINNTPIKKDPLGKLGVTFHWSEYDFGIKEDTPMRGERAYKFLEKMINIDIEQNKRQKFLEIELEKGNEINEFFYYKTQISLRYGATELKDHVRIDLGDFEFGGKTKVSDALEYRLNLYTNDLIKNAVQHAEMINKIVDSQEKQGAIPIYERTTPERIIEEANEVKKETKKIIGHFREKENIYLSKNKDLIKNEYWKIEFNEHNQDIKNYKDMILTKDLLKEFKELNNKLYNEQAGIYKFYFEHIKNEEVVDKVRIDIGSNNYSNEFTYLNNRLEELKTEKMINNKWSKKLEKSRDSELEL